MDELGIVFCHHDTSPAAARNLEALRENNPGTPVFTLSARNPFPGGARMDELGEGGAAWRALTRGDPRQEWRHCDWLGYAWTLSRRASCRRWLFAGWDVYSTMPVREFLGPVWDSPLAAVEWFRPDKDKWHWFREGAAPGSDPSLLRGLCPVCFYLCSDRAARAIADLALARRGWDAFCELRLGTLARAAGLEADVIPGARATVSWRREGWKVEGRGVWHPVKSLEEVP